MGVNIYMENAETGEQVEGWDSFRYAGDKHFWEHFGALEFDQMTPPGFPYEDDRSWVRPKDFAAFRSLAATVQHNPDRWMLAADLLEANPKAGLYFSW